MLLFPAWDVVPWWQEGCGGCCWARWDPFFKIITVSYFNHGKKKWKFIIEIFVKFKSIKASRIYTNRRVAAIQTFLAFEMNCLCFGASLTAGMTSDGVYYPYAHFLMALFSDNNLEAHVDYIGLWYVHSVWWQKNLMFWPDLRIF